MDRGLRDALAKEAFPERADSMNIAIHIGPIVSGAAVVEAPGLLPWIRRHQDRKVIGLEMEIYGVMYAVNHANQPRPVGVCAKTVSDFARAGRDRSFQPQAAFLSAAFMREWLERLP